MTACLHSEFEGGGVYDLLQAAYAALGFAIAAAAACSIPLIGWAICLIFSLVSALITLGGIIYALNDEGNPSDANPNISSIHVATSPDGNGADVLMIEGIGSSIPSRRLE